jgi:hypothetical protein
MVGGLGTLVSGYTHMCKCEDVYDLGQDARQCQAQHDEHSTAPTWILVPHNGPCELYKAGIFLQSRVEVGAGASRLLNVFLPTLGLPPQLLLGRLRCIVWLVPSSSLYGALCVSTLVTQILMVRK